MRRMGWAAAAAAIVAVAMGGVRMVGAEGSDNDEQRRFKQCSAATLWGDYGIQIQGTRPAPGGLTESVIGVVLRSYDGNGSFTQVDNVKGSITNTVPDRPGFGTYEVNPDCTGLVHVSSQRWAPPSSKSAWSSSTTGARSGRRSWCPRA